MFLIPPLDAVSLTFIFVDLMLLSSLFKFSLAQRLIERLYHDMQISFGNGRDMF